MKIPLFDRATFFERWDCYLRETPAHGLAMYSSLVRGIVTDPALMWAPIEDHLVHRGDGVFETIKCVRGGIYQLAGHLDRLERSARGIRLTFPGSRAELTEQIIETARATGRADMLLRVLLARGPGGFGVNPHECPNPQVYIIAYPVTPPFMTRYPAGAHVGFSAVPPKPAFFAEMKTCNYLPNALMAMESADRGLHFVFCLDAEGYVLEGATENMAMVNCANELVTPPSSGLLSGTTLERGWTLAEALVQRGVLSGTRRAPVHRDQLAEAREVLIFGTTPHVTAVTQLEGARVGNGKPGPVQRELDRALERDMNENEELRTRVR